MRLLVLTARAGSRATYGRRKHMRNNEYSPNYFARHVCAPLPGNAIHHLRRKATDV
jgi:hypothetical protein